jgi:hypothetical protein
MGGVDGGYQRKWGEDIVSKKSQLTELDKYAHHLIEHLDDLVAISNGIPCNEIKGCKDCPLVMPTKFDDMMCTANILDFISEEIAEKYTVKNKVKK